MMALSPWNRPSVKMTEKLILPPVKVPFTKQKRTKTMDKRQLQLVKDAIEGNRCAVQKLVNTLTPVIQASVARVISGYQFYSGQFSISQDVADYCQDIFLSLFKDDSKVLKSWDPEKGMSLNSFISLVAKRRTISILRQNKTTQNLDEDEIDSQMDEHLRAPDMESVFFNRHLLIQIISLLKEDISELGYHIFVELFLYEKTPEELSEQTGISKNAIYVWKNRLRGKVKEIMEGLNQTPLITPKAANGFENREVSINE